MRFLLIIVACAASVSFMTGCGTVVSSAWQNSARQCMDTAISAGAEKFVPAEAENIRETMKLADLNLGQGQTEQADRLYRLSSQKCQLISAKLFPRSTVIRLSQGQAQGGQLALRADEVDVQGDFSELAEVKLDDSAVSGYMESGVKVADPAPPQTVRPRARKIYRNKALRTPSEQEGWTAPRRANPSATTLYLTFDDGPSYLTLPIANYLKSEGIPATFFVLGRNVKGREKAVAATVAMGHRVANHTFSHNLKNLKASLAGESSEVKRTAAIIERLGGDGKMVRIPYGATDASIRPKVAAEGAQIFDWDINSNDSTLRGVRDHQLIERSVFKNLNRSAKRHQVVLFHDGAGHDSTLTALKELIPRLKQEGYRFGLLVRSEKTARSSSPQQVLQ